VRRGSRARRGFGSFALAWALFGCATRPSLAGFDLDGWQQLREGSIEIVGDAPEADLRRLADDLALFIAVVRETTNAPIGTERLPTRICLLSNQAAFRFGFGGLGGFMKRVLDGYLAMVRLDRGHSPHSRLILFHEYTHFLLHQGSAVDYPLWYHEGLADVLSTVRRRENVVELGSAPMGRAALLTRLRRFDLADVFEATKYADVDDIDAFYAGSWAAVHYLSATEERGARLARFVGLLVAGVPWRDAYPQAFDVPLDALSREVYRHGVALAGGAPYTLLEFDARSLDVERRPRDVRALLPGEAAASLGDFWLRFSGDDEAQDEESVGLARAFFERALAAGPEDPRVRAGLALARARQRDFTGARADAARALELAPADARVQTLAGEVDAAHARRLADAGDAHRSERARLAARAAFFRAAELDPGDPIAWAGVGASYVGEAGDLGPGIAALERAIELGAWAPGPRLDLGRLYAASGQIARAREALEEVARFDEGSAGERAAELLAELAASEP
jgi:Flp pilus assembly protein TadD